MAHILQKYFSQALNTGEWGAISPIISTIQRLMAVTGVFNGRIARHTHTHDDARVFGDYRRFRGVR